MDEERQPDGLDSVRRASGSTCVSLVSGPRTNADSGRPSGTCTTSSSLADVTCATSVRMDALVYRHAIAL
jgi:hypothetical protein